MKFYSKFWLVFVIFVPIGILFYKKSLAPQDILSGLVKGGGGYNGEWWYVFQYIKFLLVFPFLELALYILQEKKGRTFLISAAILGFCAVIGIRLLAWNTILGKMVRFAVNQLNSSYMKIFIIAILIGRYKLFEVIEKKYVIPLWGNTVLLLVCIVLRWLLVTEPGQSNCDVLLAPILVFALTGILHSFRKGSKIMQTFAFLGKYSIFMWLVHTFWIYYYFQRIVLLPRYSVLIFIWATIISLGNGFLLDNLYRLIAHLFKPSPKTSFRKAQL